MRRSKRNAAQHIRGAVGALWGRMSRERFNIVIDDHINLILRTLRSGGRGRPVLQMLERVVLSRSPAPSTRAPTAGPSRPTATPTADPTAPTRDHVRDRIDVTVIKVRLVTCVVLYIVNTATAYWYR